MLAPHEIAALMLVKAAPDQIDMRAANSMRCARSSSWNSRPWLPARIARA